MRVTTFIFVAAMIIYFSPLGFAQTVEPTLKEGILDCSSSDQLNINSGEAVTSLHITTKPFQLQFMGFKITDGSDCGDYCKYLKVNKMPYSVPLQFAAETESKTSVIHLFQTKKQGNSTRIFATLTKQDDGSYFSWIGYGDYPKGWYLPFNCLYR